LHHIFFFHGDAIKKIYAKNKENGGPHNAKHERRAEYGEEHAGIDRMAHEVIRTRHHKLMPFFYGRRPTPVPAQMPPRPDRKRDAKPAQDDAGKLDALAKLISQKMPPRANLEQYDDDRNERNAYAGVAPPFVITDSLLDPYRGDKPIYPKDDPKKKDEVIKNFHKIFYRRYQ